MSMWDLEPQRGIPIFFVLAWIFGALLSLGFMAVVVWAIIKLVTRFTAG